MRPTLVKFGVLETKCSRVDVTLGTCGGFFFGTYESKRYLLITRRFHLLKEHLKVNFCFSFFLPWNNFQNRMKRRKERKCSIYVDIDVRSPPLVHVCVVMGNFQDNFFFNVMSYIETSE